MRIPITMCHGASARLNNGHLETCFRIAAEMSFKSISYDDLEAWRAGQIELERPIMFDFDHPNKSIYDTIFPVMQRFGFKGTLFMHTQPLEEMYAGSMPNAESRQCLTWDEIRKLMAAGWHIGAHTHSHPNLSDLRGKDPKGNRIREELEKNDEILKKELGLQPKDFAFTGTSWSSMAEQEVMKRYRFGRLWIIGAMYEADGQPIRYAELAGVEGDDEADGGPPFAARYITLKTNPYRLPSMELEKLIYEYNAYRFYLEGALEAG